jgi:predicted ATPase
VANLIARQTQLAQLNAILKSALQGRLQIVFVTGEAGVGKTALMAAFVEQAKSEVAGLFVAGSKCYTIAGGQQAYLPFVQILEVLSIGKKGNAIWDQLRRGMAELAPDWLQLLPYGGTAVAAVVLPISN